MSAPLGITGSTGNLGGRIAPLLAETSAAQRLLVRDPGRAPDLPGTDVVQAHYGEFDAVRRALDGLDTVLMVSGAESATRLVEHKTFVDAAVAAGVEHLVYVSFYGASADATFTLARDHDATERHIEGAGIKHTFLRDNLYADFFPLMADEHGVIRGPAGDGRVAAVTQDDIAAVAVAVLTDPSAHAGATYSLTGPEALTLTEVAEVMTRATGRPHRFEDETLEQAYASRSSYGAPDWQVDAWVSTYTAIASGELAGVSHDIERVTGRNPLSLEQLFTRSQR